MRHQWASRRYGPPPFVRRMGCAFGMLIVLAAIGASTLVSLLFHAPQQSLVIGATGLAILMLVTAGFVFAMSRVTRVFREQDRLRRQLIADVAHELRTPLAILQGRIEGLADGVYPRDDAHIAELLDETRHLGRLVDDLRTIANAEAGALELRKEKVEVAELIRDVASSFDRPITIVVVDSMPAIDADPVRLREVLLNVVSNAVRHTPSDGEIRMTAVTNGRRTILRVIDTGSGIAPEDLPRIFDRFQKGRDSRGSGLGLAIARNLVLAHGGDIRAESEPGRGTTITITLPA